MIALTGALVGGKINARPTMSVRKPGVNKSAPPSKMSAPSATSRVGI
jgi:hypothetical protein